MSSKATRFSLLVCLSAAGTVLPAQTPYQAGSGASSQTWAQPPVETRLGAPVTASPVTLRPVPVQSVRPQLAPAPQQPSNPNLRWRRSSNAPTPAATNVQASTQAPQRTATARPNSGVAQAAWVGDSPSNAESAQVRPVSSPTRANFFEDPFGDNAGQTLVQAVQRPQAPSQPPVVEMIAPPPADELGEVPGGDPPINALRELPMDEETQDSGFELPAPVAEAPNQVTDPPREAVPQADGTRFELPPVPAAEAPADPVESKSLREMLQDQAPKNRLDDSASPDNPFPRTRYSDEMDRGPLETERRGRAYEDGLGMPGSQSPSRAADFSCEDFRKRIAAQTIDLVSLDVSPPYRPDELDQERYERMKADLLESQSIRQWRNRDGEPMATGRLTDLAYEKAVIETEEGKLERLPINRLSEGDIAYITDNWGLPKECLVEQVAYVPRQWTPTTMTWMASNLCHNPLYFEDVNLERYGHTHGPVLEPIVQSAHFFGNVLVLPYKMGVHAPNECQYALGYYRPGNCAPWIKPPVPISARGAIAQAATMTGMFWLIP
jgi:hypothetical protein